MEETLDELKKKLSAEEERRIKLYRDYQQCKETIRRLQIKIIDLGEEWNNID